MSAYKFKTGGLNLRIPKVLYIRIVGLICRHEVIFVKTLGAIQVH